VPEHRLVASDDDEPIVQPDRVAHYWITSSARASTDGGMVRPRADIDATRDARAL